MGKSLIQQKRGKGSSTYRARAAGYKVKISYPSTEGLGKVIKLISIAGFTSPLALIKVNKENFFSPATEGLFEGQDIQIGKNAEIRGGNILPLASIPTGTSIFNIETFPGSGGKLVRSSGLSAKVIKKIVRKAVIELPSKEEKMLDDNCRATIGIIAGGGRVDKPFVKAGKRWHLMKARGKMYPRTSPVKMNAVCHPFGGGRGKNIGKSTIAPRNAPPGRKVGLLRPRKTGRGN
jgi:large subunit ribosomal protein L2